MQRTHVFVSAGLLYPVVWDGLILYYLKQGDNVTVLRNQEYRYYSVEEQDAV
jgi:hypothetical protein